VSILTCWAQLQIARDGSTYMEPVLEHEHHAWVIHTLFERNVYKTYVCVYIYIYIYIHYRSKVWGHPDNFVSSMKTHFY